MRKLTLCLIAIFIVATLSFAEMPKSRSVEFDYQVKIEDIPKGALDLKIWLPILPDNHYQMIEDIQFDPKESATITSDKTFHNKILTYAFKSLPSPILNIRVHYKVKRLEYANKIAEINSFKEVKNNQENLKRFLKPDQLVTLSPRIKQLASKIIKGKKVHPKVHAIVVPGSGQVKAQAEKEGLDKIFTEAGYEWRYAGCSMCLGMNDDRLNKGERCASSSNRNFEGRQGPGGRTHLMSPEMVAAAAIEGKISDVRKYL